ncbi:hypothetical protein GEMRC1_013192 [Eukaryota sp. GEM-RC1]
MAPIISKPAKPPPRNKSSGLRSLPRKCSCCSSTTHDKRHCPVCFEAEDAAATVAACKSIPTERSPLFDTDVFDVHSFFGVCNFSYLSLLPFSNYRD